MGVARDPHGPAIAWFKDNAGNILAVIEDSSANRIAHDSVLAVVHE